MFFPPLTPVWGMWLKLIGDKARVDERIWGQGLAKDE
jgi:hypothetical protein